VRTLKRFKPNIYRNEITESKKFREEHTKPPYTMFTYINITKEYTNQIILQASNIFRVEQCYHVLGETLQLSTPRVQFYTRQNLKLLVLLTLCVIKSVMSELMYK